MKSFLAVLSAVLICGGCASAQRAVTTPLQLWWGDYGRGHAARISSYDRTGANNDSIQLLAGQTVDLADIQGPGIIRRIWMTTNESGPVGRMLVVRMYWDGAVAPAVEVPYGDFFGVGNGMDADVDSFPITVVSRGRSRNCWWPMPFATRARITVTNEGPRPHGAFYFHIDYLALDAPPPTPERFHAQYRQAYPAESKDNYLILDTRGRGHYVGTVMSVESTRPQWWGEGDELIEADNHEPLHGTGTEEYFGDAWGMHAHSTLWHGSPVCEGYDEAGKRTSMYRFHILDPIPFQERLRVSIEHGTQNDRADNLSSVAFWYQVPPAAPYPALASVVDRVVGEDRANLVRGEAWRAAQSGASDARERLDALLGKAPTPDTRKMIEGLQIYSESLAHPTREAARRLGEKCAEMQKLVESEPVEKRYMPPATDLPTDDDSPIPGPILQAALILDRARFDLERRAALAEGFQPGDELVVESRDAEGKVTPAPAYEDSKDFTNSYAKVTSPYTSGNGARFTYGNAPDSWARFTPDFPVAGRYEVFVIFSYGANANDTRYEIRHTGGVATVPLPQHGRPGTAERNHGKWISLGTYRFASGQDPQRGSVMLLASPGTAIPNPKFEYRAYADAVRFVFQAPSQ